MAHDASADQIVHDVTFDELSAAQFHAIARLRSTVFVVEQACVYLDLDGRDDSAGTRHVWIGDARHVHAYLRLLADPAAGATRIGRVVTHPDHRGRGLAASLLDHVLRHHEGPWVLDAQSQLEDWYRRFGFERCGDDYVEDGIPHTPMRRANPIA